MIYNWLTQTGFCKTAYKPYDIVVTACLVILQYRLGDAIQVSSDGGAVDWVAGVNLARSVIRCKVPNPIGPRRAFKAVIGGRK